MVNIGRELIAQLKEENVIYKKAINPGSPTTLRKKMVKLAMVFPLIFLLTSCDDSYKLDNSPIAHDDFARIQLESDICNHSGNTYDCLKHLKGRIQ